MRSNATPSFETTAALEAISRGLAAARLRRRDTQAVAAARLGISTSTWQRIEQGDPTVAWGVMLDALIKYGFEKQVFSLGDPALDAEGKLLDRKNLPQRGRRKTAP